ncbi:alkylation response protein AidB-like acyl-CoA dehydrogenase [Sphingopyxis panaciterrae]|uniref:acyl-CoA dehydrogenase n=1 Tax=Sphingopyxis panaciterrae TaxID=363841 RepID=UPI00141E901F|nr:acyl-CoA dehydrogenase [Sphingopyxis panaciterrae]NIJ36736.1 alkylation response protein AidB-like acyl-CoA dehydrogenase [Sphingopyxis panaciterrae]
MHFHLTEEQAAIQDAVRGTLADTWPIERLHAFADGDADFDRDSWQALMTLGLGGILLPDSGMGLLEAALVCEVAGEAAAAGPLIGQLLAVAAASASDKAGSHVDALVNGERVATVVHGGSAFVPCARAADLFLIVDRDAGVRLVPAGEGVTIEAVKASDRSRPVSKVEIADGAGDTLFAADDPMTARLADAALVLVAADALGGAQKVAAMSVAYAKEREQFGQPIGRFQALKHQLAHMALDVEPARALVWYAAYAWDVALPDTPRAAAMAKAHLCDIYVRTARAAVAAHGGIGYTWEYGLHYWFRRAMFDRAWLGSPAEHRARAATLAGW